MVLVAGPRVAREALPAHAGLDVLPYVHNLFEHLACSDLALVQGGLSTCMELVATQRPLPELPARAPLRAVHPREEPPAQLLRRLLGALRELSTGELAERALAGDARAGRTTGRSRPTARRGRRARSSPSWRTARGRRHEPPRPDPRSPTPRSLRMPVLIALYGVVAYAVFLGTFLYAIGFVTNIVVPKTIDLGLPLGAAGEPLAISLLVDVAAAPRLRRPAQRDGAAGVQALVDADRARGDGAQHLRAARERRADPAVLAMAADRRRRSGRVRAAVLGLALLWRCARLGWLLVLASTFLIDHFELFGLKQVWHRLTGRSAVPPRNSARRWLYRHVRHPIYLGFILAFWATPTMSAGHLLFAVGDDGLHPRRHLVRGARPDRAVRPALPRLSRQVGMLLPRFGRARAGPPGRRVRAAGATKVERRAPS